MRCSLCSHDQRPAIEAAVQATSIDAAADKFGVSARALSVHTAAHTRAAKPKTATSKVRKGRARRASPARSRAASPAEVVLEEDEPATSRSPVAVTARAKVDQLLSSLKAIADSIGTDATVQQRVAVLRASVAPIKLLGQLTGELGASESTVASSPHYRRVRTAIVEALRPFPTAARAVLEALELAERGGVVVDVSEAAE